MANKCIVIKIGQLLNIISAINALLFKLLNID